MSRIKTSIEIRHPQEQTFAYPTDPRNATEWSTELVDVARKADQIQSKKVKEILEARSHEVPDKERSMA